MKKTLKALLVVLVLSLLALTTLTACDPCSEGHSFEGQPWLTDGTHHWQQCVNCDAISEKVAHTYNGYQSDATNHWQVCSVCSKATEKVAHSPEADDGDCTTEILCSVCDKQTTAGESAHAYGEWVVDGNNHKRTCANCSKVDSHSAEIAEDDGDCTTDILCKHCTVVMEEGAENHTVVVDQAVAPLCNLEGKTEGSHCSVCEKVIVAQEEIPATGIHTFDKDAEGRFYVGSCEGCGRTYKMSEDYILIDWLYDGYAYQKGANETQALDLSRLDVGKVTSLKVAGKEAELCESLTDLADGIVRLTNMGSLYGNAYGPTQFNVVGTKGSATVTLTVITKIITTEEELAMVKTTSHDLYGGGYFELGNDIRPATVGGTIQVSPLTTTHNWKGTFDGMGYVIDGLAGFSGNQGFVGKDITAEGIIRNVGFTNVVHTDGCASMLAMTNNGTIENIYIHYKSTGKNSRTLTVYNFTGKVDNVFVDASDAEFISISGQPTMFLLCSSQWVDNGYNLDIMGVAPAGCDNLGRYCEWKQSTDTYKDRLFADFTGLKANATASANAAAWSEECEYWKYDAETGEILFGHTAINHKHSPEKIEAKQATCAVPGHTEHYACSCGKLFSDAQGENEISASDVVTTKAHNYGSLQAEVTATCSATGRAAYYQCGECQKYFNAEQVEKTWEELELAINPNAHDFGEWVGEVAATCSATGTKGHKDCQDCGKHFDNSGVEIADLTIAKDLSNHANTTEFNYAQNVDGTTHKVTYKCCGATKSESVACSGGSATCLVKATCDHCKQEYGNKLAHSADSDEQWVTTDPDNHWKVCSTEGCTERVEIALHTWVEGTITKPATETETGIQEYNCTCGAKKEVELPLATHQHAYTPVEATAPSCTEDGVLAHYTCTCGKYFSKSGEDYTEIQKADTVDKAPGHVYGNLVDAKSATCQEKGNYAYYKCSECNLYFNSDKEEKLWSELEIAIDENAHDLVDDDAVPATCSTAGKQAGKHCSRCDYTEGGAEIPATGIHTFVLQSNAKYTTAKCSGCSTYNFRASATHVNLEKKWTTTWETSEANVSTDYIDLSAQLPEDFGYITSVKAKTNFSGKTDGIGQEIINSSLKADRGFRINSGSAYLVYYWGPSVFTVVGSSGQSADVTITFVTDVVRTVAEYQQIATTISQCGGRLNASINKPGGYFELGCDIRPADSEYISVVPLVDFAGVLDGCGYVIDSLKFDTASGSNNEAGFITIGRGATLKNIGLTNIVITASARDVKILGQYTSETGATVENVYVSVASQANCFRMIHGDASHVAINNLFADYTALSSFAADTKVANGTSGDNDSFYAIGVTTVNANPNGQTAYIRDNNTATAEAAWAALKNDASASAAMAKWATDYPTLWKYDATTGKVTFGITAIAALEPADV